MFQKIYDEIMYLYKVAAAGSKEARELEKVKKAFEKAYKEGGKTQKNTADGGAKYSIETLPDGKKYVQADRQVIYGNDPDSWSEQVEDYINGKIRKGENISLVAEDGEILTLTANTAGKIASNKTSHGTTMSDEKFYVKSNAGVHIDELAQVSVNDNPNKKPKADQDARHGAFAEGGWTYRTAFFHDFDGKYYRLKISAAMGKDGTVVYNIGDIDERSFPKVTGSSAKGGALNGKASSAAKIAQNGKNVKYSLSDSDGKQLSKEQQEYFKDSKMRDENGNLKVMYHGSQNAGFHVFDARMSDDDTSFFFVDRNDAAATYSGTSEVYEAKTIRTAEDMNNFLAEIGYDQYEAVEKNGKFELLENGDHVAWSDTAQGIYEEFCWYEGVGEGDANYKVYLNLKNPLEVDVKGKNWNNISREFSQEIADRYHSLTAEEKAALQDLTEWGEYGIFKDEMLEARAGGNSILASAYEKLGGANANLYDAFSIASDNFSEDAISQFAVKQMNTRDYAQKAKAEGYDGVIFKNIVDLGGYSNGSEGAATVAIAFDSNQIKSTANAKPTGDADIRYSLSDNENINKVTEDGLTMTYVRVPNQNTQNYGSTYGQNIEPAGEYMSMDTMQGKHKIDGYEYGTIQFKKPLVLEHINTSDTGWKKTVSDMYNGLTGKKLTEALIKDGYDAIVTYDDYGYNEIVNLNGKKLSDQGVRFSLSKAVEETAVKSYAEITEEQQNLYQREMQLQAQKREAENNPELLQAMDDFSSLFTEMRGLLPKRHNGTATQAELDRIEEIKVLREERLNRVADLQESLGLNAIAKEEAEIRETKEALRVAADAAWAREGAEKENQAIEKAGVPAAEYFRKKALKAFKTTTNFNEAGYMLPDGKLLNFSGGERNNRYRDHREIGEIYEATQGVAALNRFMRDGNIRIMAESPGIDLTSVVEPTKEQYAALRKFINTNGSAEGQFFVDFSGTKGERVGNYSYNGRIIADRIINDIKYFYQNGKVRESSGLLDFLSLSAEGERPRTFGNYNVSGKDIALEIAPVAKDVAPVKENLTTKTETVAPVAEVADMFPDTPIQSLEELTAEAKDIMGAMEAYEAVGDTASVEQLMPEYEAVMEQISQLEEAERQRVDSLTEADVPPEMDAPYYGDDQSAKLEDPFESRDWHEVGNKKVKAYMYENPEVKPFFQAEALNLLGELNSTTKGERWYNDELYYESGGEAGFGGVKRHTSASMEELLDGWGMSYADIEKGLNAIIEDHGAENIAAAKKLEFMLNDRLLNGYKDFYTNGYVSPNQDYINLLTEKQITEYSKEAFDAFMANADQYAPAVFEDIAPVVENVTPEAPIKEAHEAIRPKQDKEPRMAKATPAEQARAQILTEEPKVNKKKPSAWNLFKDNFVDKGTIFETLSLKTGNRELQGKWKAIGRAESSAQWFMENGNASTSSLKAIRDTVEKSGKTQQFYEYLYHQHNVDRMNLENRYADMENKPVFGYDVTSEMSRKEAAKLENANPEFKEWANEVYSYMTYLREMMVDSGVISSETAKLWAEMYPHYVPVRRMGDDGLNINVALDTNRTGVNAPIKRATGGNRDILPLFDTMAMRTEQTFKAVARNRFGVELKNMLGTAFENEAVDIDEAIDSVETELLQEGKDGRNPTFTVFENGEKVTFEITEEMYDTMKPKSKAMGYTNKVLNTANNIRRGLLTEYNPAFMLTNPIKDTQDVLINSQHPARTYANYPKAIAELIGKGQYYQEYMENGGEQNTYFDGESKTFTKEKSGLSKVIGFPLEKISQANNFIERVPRMAEYIASRKDGRSVDVSMLDAARVTTDFSAGGDLVKMANRNGFTFLNASVQGAVQQVRNVREAKAEGLKGWAKLAAKVTAAGLPALLLNHLLWDDDEDYAELSDYVKQNYYIVGKYGDGKFVRIPKGRALAVIQNAFEQVENLVTGDDEVDLRTFGELVISNLAPNNPLENNLIAPITQALSNKTWYGDDLVPSRLQDLPTEEQYDETTDSISKWLGEHTPISPYKWNYLLDQYSGAIGDVFLPMITPEAERGNDTLAGDMIAPITDKFTTDGVMKNQNVSDFYDKKDELTTNAKASGATEEDVLMNQYMNSINSELSELYAKKREIQNSDLSNAEKYDAVRDIQKQIVDLTRESLATYDDIDYQSARDGEYVNIGTRYFKQDDEGEWQKLSDEQVTKYKVTRAGGNSSYASDGTNHYRWYVSEDGETEGWRKISGDELERQNKVTKGLGISPEAYWNNKDEYSYAYDHPENYAVSKAVGGYESYRNYSKELYDIKADKDKNGKSISGSRKEKVIDYINNLDADYGEKIILFKSEYPSDDTYNYEIIDYLNGREDISYSEMETILKELGFNVSSDGHITWD